MITQNINTSKKTKTTRNRRRRRNKNQFSYGRLVSQIFRYRFTTSESCPLNSGVVTRFSVMTLLSNVINASQLQDKWQLFKVIKVDVTFTPMVSQGTKASPVYIMYSFGEPTSLDITDNPSALYVKNSGRLTIHQGGINQVFNRWYKFSELTEAGGVELYVEPGSVSNGTWEVGFFYNVQVTKPILADTTYITNKISNGVVTYSVGQHSNSVKINNPK